MRGSGEWGGPEARKRAPAGSSCSTSVIEKPHQGDRCSCETPGPAREGGRGPETGRGPGGGAGPRDRAGRQGPGGRAALAGRTIAGPLKVTLRSLGSVTPAVLGALCNSAGLGPHYTMPGRSLWGTLTCIQRSRGSGGGPREPQWDSGFSLVLGRMTDTMNGPLADCAAVRRRHVPGPLPPTPRHPTLP